jgi:hypothetical protein
MVRLSVEITAIALMSLALIFHFSWWTVAAAAGVFSALLGWRFMRDWRYQSARIDALLQDERAPADDADHSTDR